MADPEARPLTVVHPGQGRAGDLGAIGVVFKLWGHDTGGALSIVEHPFPVGALVPPRLHTREDEYSIVTDGEIGLRSGDREADESELRRRLDRQQRQWQARRGRSHRQTRSGIVQPRDHAADSSSTASRDATAQLAFGLTRGAGIAAI